MVPQRLPFSDLLFLPYCARLPTLFVGKSISVIDNSPTTSPSTTSPLATPTSSPLPPSLSTMLTFLDYSLFSDGVPPPPPNWQQCHFVALHLLCSSDVAALRQGLLGYLRCLEQEPEQRIGSKPLT
ncbi:hypothetical protein JHK86_035365 [Glycine max]|nr:hypothetical protein JHK86_035365 [Glycine max]